MRQCIVEIQNAARNSGRELLEDEIMDILDILERRRRQRSGSINSQSELDDLVAEAMEIAKQAKLNAYIEKRNRIINTKRYVELKRKLDADPANRGTALSAVLVGSAKYSESGRLSVDAQGHAIMTDSTGLLLAELQKTILRSYSPAISWTS